MATGSPTEIMESFVTNSAPTRLDGRIRTRRTACKRSRMCSHRAQYPDERKDSIAEKENRLKGDVVETDAERPAPSRSLLSRRAVLSTAVLAPVLGSILGQAPDVFASDELVAIDKMFAQMIETTLGTASESSIPQFKRRFYEENIPPGSRVLELGDGAGRDIKYYPPDVSVVVVDQNSDRQLHIASRVSDADAYVTSQKLEFTSSSSGKFSSSFAEGEFDIVVMTFPLSTVDEPENVLDQVSYVLKPGGKLLFIDQMAEDRTTSSQFVQKLLNPIRERLSDEWPTTIDTETLIRSSRNLAVRSLERLKVSGVEAAVAYPQVFGVAKKI